MSFELDQNLFAKNIFKHATLYSELICMTSKKTTARREKKKEMKKISNSSIFHSTKYGMGFLPARNLIIHE